MYVHVSICMYINCIIVFDHFKFMSLLFNNYLHSCAKEDSKIILYNEWKECKTGYVKGRIVARGEGNEEGKEGWIWLMYFLYMYEYEALKPIEVEWEKRKTNRGDEPDFIYMCVCVCVCVCVFYIYI
jgi:hypothetical protein